MPAGLPVALALLAQVAARSEVAGPAAPPTVEAAAPAKSECTTPAAPDPNSREIVVCALRPQGYRLDPDVLAARRLKKKGETVRPRNPHETYVDRSCATVGPMGCRGQPTIDVFTAAAAFATMAGRLSNGQEIGSMFQTRPTSSEYQLYLQAKKLREEEEADKAQRVQCDEIWSFCYAKAKNVATAKRQDLAYGDVWTWTAIEAQSKLLISYMVGGRDADPTLKRR